VAALIFYIPTCFSEIILIDIISYIRTANNSESILEFFLGVYSLTGLLMFLFISKYLVSLFLLIYPSGFSTFFFFQ